MADFKHTHQGRTIKLAPGFYVYRYLCKGNGPLPIVTLGFAPGGSGGEVSFVGKRRAGQVTLDSYGDMAVVHVEGGEGRVGLNLFVPEGFPQRSVNIEVERLTLDQADPHVAPVHTDRSVNIALAGHVEFAGDVEVAKSQWLGDPNAKARLEGFSVLWPQRPYGVDIAYKCVVASLGQSTPTLTGGFAGTRRRAMPIRSVHFEIVGERAEHYEILVHAAFAKRGIVTGSSADILMGLGDADYLTAIKLEVSEKPEIAPDKTNAPVVKTFKSVQNNFKVGEGLTQVI